jgi:hypothetical protein
MPRACSGWHSSARRREAPDLLEWSPTSPGLIEDLQQGHYFVQTGSAAV